MKKRILDIVLILLMCMTLVSCSNFEHTGNSIEGKNNIYKHPNIQSEILYENPNLQKVTIIREYANKWVKVSISGIEGFMLKENIDDEQQLNTDEYPSINQKNNIDAEIPMYAISNEKSEVLRIIPKGTNLIIAEPVGDGKWIKTFFDGSFGYVKAENVQIEEENTQTEPLEEVSETEKKQNQNSNFQAEEKQEDTKTQSKAEEDEKENKERNRKSLYGMCYDNIMYYENKAIWSYEHGGKFPTKYLSKKEGKIYYRYYNDNGILNPIWNIGPGIVVSRDYNYEMFSKCLGVDVSTIKTLFENGYKSSDKVYMEQTYQEVNDTVLKSVIEKCINTVKKETEKYKMKNEQLAALVAVQYQYGNIKGFKSTYHLYEEGDYDGFRKAFFVKGEDGKVYYPFSGNKDEVKDSNSKRSNSNYALFYLGEWYYDKDSIDIKSTTDASQLIEYKQFDERWASLKTPWKSNFGVAGCGPTSVATMLSCYGHKYNPKDINTLYGQGDNLSNKSWQTINSYQASYSKLVSRLLGKKVKWKKVTKQALKKQLEKGACMLHIEVNTDGKWSTSSGHFMVATHLNKDGSKVYISDVGSSRNTRNGWFDIEEVVSKSNHIDLFLKVN